MEAPGLTGTESCKPYGNQAGNWIMRPMKEKLCVKEWTSKGWKDHLTVECEQEEAPAPTQAPPPKRIIVVGSSEETEKCMEAPGLTGTETCKPYGNQAGNWIMRPRKEKLCVEEWTPKGWKDHLTVECV